MLLGVRDTMSCRIDRLSTVLTLIGYKKPCQLVSLFGNGRIEFYYKEFAFLIKLPVSFVGCQIYG